MKTAGRLGWIIVLVAMLASTKATGTETLANSGPIAIGMLAHLWGPTEDMLGVRDGLAELGLRQDEQVALGVRYAAGDANRLDAMARQVLRDGATILYASGWKALEAAQRVTTRTPIVFTTWYNPPGTTRYGKAPSNVAPGSVETLRV
jgi:ABC-type uncharacterized transport system substrate-binding protein